MLFGRNFRTASVICRKSALWVAAGAAVAVGFVGAPAANASTPEWQLVYRGAALPSGSNALMGVTAINATNAWAVGDRGSGSARRPTFLHWNGHTWSNYSNTSLGKIPGIAQFDPMTIESTAANNVWIFGINSAGSYSAVVYHGSGEWSAATPPVGLEPSLTAVLSPTNVWGVSAEGCGTGLQQCIEHWNGRTWSSTTVSGTIESVTTDGKYVYFLALTGVKFLSTYSIGTPVIYKPSSTMQVIAGPKLQITDEADSLVVETNGHKYLEGRLTTGSHPFRYWYFNGSTWSQMSIPASVCPPGESGSCPLIIDTPMMPDGGNGFWDGYEGHWTGAKWIDTNVFSGAFYLSPDSWGIRGMARVPGTSDVWGAGVFISSSNTSYNMMTAYPAIP